MTKDELDHAREQSERYWCSGCGRLVSDGYECPTCAELDRQFDRHKERNFQ